MNSKHRTFSSSKNKASHSHVVSKYCNFPLRVSTRTIKASVGHIQFAGVSLTDMVHVQASDVHTRDKR